MNAIMSERPQLINLSYRLLGSLAEAEDAVQETYARWYAVSRPEQDAIESPGAWLTTVASRICLNMLGSARARRERGVGSQGHRRPDRPARPRRHGDRRRRRPRRYLPGPHRRRRADRSRLDRDRQPGHRRHEVAGTHRQRPARPGGPAGRHHRDGVRVRRRRRPDQAHLGHPQPRQAPALDDGLRFGRDIAARSALKPLVPNGRWCPLAMHPGSWRRARSGRRCRPTGGGRRPAAPPSSLRRWRPRRA
jgi:DNA-directed RNA polymerase specialized sigma24 family protein